MEAYSIHGHTRPGADDEDLLAYEDFFLTIVQSDLRALRFLIGTDTVAVADVETRGSQVALLFVSGNATELPLVYDASTATTQEVDPGKNRLIVSSAWAIIDPSTRIMVLERKRPGVPVYQVERFLSQFGRDVIGLPALAISLNPVPSASFIREIDQFNRIREAAITLRRPNHSWTASAEAMLGELAESNAAEVQLQLNADRGQSLSKSRGVVSEIVDLARRPINALKNAVIKGTTPTFEGERSVSLRRHTVKGATRIDSSAGPRVQLESLAPLAESLTTQILSTDSAPPALDDPVGSAPAESREIEPPRS